MIICCGEALIDMLPRQLSNGDDVYLPVSGGAIFNTAITLGRLGAPAGLVSGISTDIFGQQLMTSLKQSNVETELCIRSGHPSTLAFVKLINGQAQYSFMDENSAGRLVSIDNLPTLPSNINALHFGAISLIPEPCGTAFETLMTRHHKDSVISLDPNIRPGFIDDEQTHRARIERMVAMSDIVKVSDEDLEWIAPDVQTENAIEQMLTQSGVSVVVLTKGSQGVSVFTANEHLDLNARSVEAIDTVGAGDSFNGGFLEGLRSKNLLTKSALREANASDLKSAVQLATDVAAITVSRVGANPPWAQELEEFRKTGLI